MSGPPGFCCLICSFCGNIRLTRKRPRVLMLLMASKPMGNGGGQWKVTVKDGQWSSQAVDDLSDVDAVFHFKNPSDLVLTAYQRFDGGEASGDPEAIKKVRGLFFRI